MVLNAMSVPDIAALIGAGSDDDPSRETLDAKAGRAAARQSRILHRS